MDPMTLIGIAFLLICVLFIFLLIVVSRINKLHRKVADVNPQDLYPFMEEMRELVMESERVADKLEDAVKQKEEMLEDLSALVDEKLKRFEAIDDIPDTDAGYTPPIRDEEDIYESQHSYNPIPQPPKEPERKPQPKIEIDDLELDDTHTPQTFEQQGISIREQIADMLDIGMEDSEIAKQLGVSVTEIQIVKRMDI